MDIVNANGSSYGLAKHTNVEVGEIPLMDMERMLPRQVSTGSLRGSQSVGYGKTLIDGSNNRITLGDSIVLAGDEDTISITTDTNSILSLGANPDGGAGMSITDDDGFILFKMNGQTWYWYDKTTNKNVMQVGLLPDGSYGMAVAKTGYNVSDGF